MTKTKTEVAAKRAPSFQARLLALAVSSCFSSAVYALGTAPTVVAGSATFNQSGNVMTVTNSNGTIINWGALSVLPGEKLIFDQAANSSVLNRVIGMNVNGKWVLDPTVIAGTISSKGSVWIINTSGVLVKQGAVIDVARFVGSTIDISNSNFLAGKLLFDGPAGPGTVVVEKGASITTGRGGSVYLIGSNVTNEGIITTPEGETILAAGKSVSIVDTGTPGVKVEITGSEGNVTNLGTILAEAGRIGMAGALVRNSGTLNASSVVKEGGRIFLKASQDAYVDGDGRIVTTGTKGGTVEVLGNRVAVMGNASIDASGTNGGGTVLVGGDYQGKNAAVQNSTITYFGKNASIKADATDKGNGGKVILWANDTTRAYGSISVRGGANGGNGGLIETSGHHLDMAGIRVDARAPKGKRGTWLLDPLNITIVHGGQGQSDSGSFSDLEFVPVNNASTTITDGDLNYYQNLTDLTITTSNTAENTSAGNITFNPGVSIVGYGGITFDARNDIIMSGTSITNDQNGPLAVTLQAGRHISISGSTISTGGVAANGESSMMGGVSLTAGYGTYSTGNITMSNSSIQAGSADVTLNACAGHCSLGNIVVDRISGGTVSLNANNTISAAAGSGPVNVTGKDISLSSAYGGSVAGVKAINLGVSVTSGGRLSAVVGNMFGYYGGISLRNYGVDPTAAAGLTLTDSSTQGGDLYYYSANDISSLPTLTRNYGSITIETSGDLTSNGADITAQEVTFTAAKAINLNGGTVASAGDLTLTGQSINTLGALLKSGYSGGFTAAGNITMTATQDIKLNSTTVEAGNDVVFNLQGSTSTLYLNESTDTRTSPTKVISDIYTQIPATTHVNFLSNTSGGIVINGVHTTTTTAGGSGFYVLNSSTPAQPGYGLDIVYPILSGTTGQVATETGASVEKSTTDDNLTDKTSANDSPMLTTSAPQGSQSGTGEDDGATFDSKDKKDNGNSRDNKEQSNGTSTSKNQCS